jgi:phosphoglycolate phosphatase
MSTSSTDGPLALDLDGTLLEPRERQLALLTELLRSEPGCPAVDLDLVWELKREGATTAEALRRLCVPTPVVERLARLWREQIEDRRWLAIDRPLPGVMATLDMLRRRGVRPLILTARQHPDRVEWQLAQVGLERWCPTVVVVSPAAARAEKAERLVALGCRAFAGDSESDADAARDAAVPFAAVATGQRSPRFLGSRGIESHASLLEALVALGELAPARERSAAV